MLVNGRLGVDWFRSMVFGQMHPSMPYKQVNLVKCWVIMQVSVKHGNSYPVNINFFPKAWTIISYFSNVVGKNLTHYVDAIPFVSKSASFTFKQTTISVLGAPFFKEPFEVNWNSDHYVTSVVAYHNVCTYSFSKAFITCFFIILYILWEYSHVYHLNSFSGIDL